MDSGRGVFFLGAANTTEVAKEDEALGHGILTSAILEGLSSGLADKDNDGHVSGNDLFGWCADYARRRGAPKVVMNGQVEARGVIIAYSRRRIAPETQWRSELRAPFDKTNARATTANTAKPIRPPLNVGRESLADKWAKDILAGKARAVLVLGGPGMGKTTLTKAIATHDDIEQRFGQRCWFVELATADEARKLETGIAAAVGLDATAGFNHVLDRLGEEPGVLVLDNLETPWADDPKGTGEVLSKLAGVAELVLLASLRGHRPPDMVHWRKERLEPLNDDDARRLFLEIAQQFQPDDPYLAKFLKELGGLPLAIELVAKLAELYDQLAEPWAQWEKSGVGLAERRHGDGGPRDSLIKSIELSARSPWLKETGRRLFALLGQLPAGIARVDRNVLLSETTAWEATNQLLEVALARESDGRLDLLPPVRNYARWRHEPTGKDAGAWVRHYLDLARRQGERIGSHGGQNAIELLLPEAGNLEAALNKAAADLALRPAAVDAARGFAEFVRFTGKGSDAPLVTLRDSCHDAGDVLGEAGCFVSLADIAFDRSKSDVSLEKYERAKRLYSNVGDMRGLAYCARGVAKIDLTRKDYGEARAKYEQALRLNRQAGDAVGEAYCIRYLGDIKLRESKYEAAWADYEQARKLFQKVGNAVGEANCDKGLGDIAWEKSDLGVARAKFEEALPLFRQGGALRGAANCILRLGNIELRESTPKKARAKYEEALLLFQRVGAVHGKAKCKEGLESVRKALRRSRTLQEG